MENKIYEETQTKVERRHRKEYLGGDQPQICNLAEVRFPEQRSALFYLKVLPGRGVV